MNRLIVALLASFAPVALAAETCVDLRDYATLCVPEPMSISPDETLEGTYFLGPMPNPDVWRATVFAYARRLPEGEDIEEAVVRHLNRLQFSPQPDVSIDVEGPVTIAEQEGYLRVTTFDLGPSGLGDSMKVTYAVLGLRIGNNFTIVSVDEMGISDPQILADAVKLAAEFVRPVNTP